MNTHIAQYVTSPGQSKGAAAEGQDKQTLTQTRGKGSAALPSLSQHTGGAEGRDDGGSFAPSRVRRCHSPAGGSEGGILFCPGSLCPPARDSSRRAVVTKPARRGGCKRWQQHTDWPRNGGHARRVPHCCPQERREGLWHHAPRRVAGMLITPPSADEATNGRRRCVPLRWTNCSGRMPGRAGSGTRRMAGWLARCVRRRHERGTDLTTTLQRGEGKWVARLVRPGGLPRVHRGI